MKINGTVTRHIQNQFGGFTIYKVKLKDGPMKDTMSLVGGSVVLWQCGYRYELNAERDFVYSPSGQN